MCRYNHLFNIIFNDLPKNFVKSVRIQNIIIYICWNFARRKSCNVTSWRENEL